MTLLSVWCRICHARRSEERLADCYYGELWIKLSMPAILPVGSWIELPTPQAWRSATGVSFGKISEWTLIGGFLVCEIDDSCHLGNEQVAELLAIGYSDYLDDYPEEVGEASENLFR